MINILKKYTKPKLILETDVFEKYKYLISYRLTLYLTFALSVLSIVLYFFFTLPHAILTFSGFIISLISFLFIRITGRYKEFILFFNLVGAFLCIFTLYYVKDQARIVDGFWMIISCSFTFLTLGKNWGTFISILHTLALTLFYVLFFNDQIPLIKAMTQNQINAFAVNVFICFSILYYFNWQNIKINKEAENQLNDAKKFLENQFDVINKQHNEKSILLKEVHHRVKNNLQVIVSLLRLQTKDITDELELSKYNESINRVITMSMIHEKIYQSENLSSVNIEDYFKSLAENLLHSYQVESKINLVISSKIKSMELKPIVPLALLFNELFSNSIKYAFENTEFAKIEVRLNQLSEDSFDFSYCDNGTWKTPKKAESFGLNLIEALTEQLNGKYEIDFKSGTKYQFHFENINS